MGGLWYYRRSGEQTGPVRFEELRELAGSGEITPDHEVRSSHGYWQEARSVDELWTSPSLLVSDATDASVAQMSPTAVSGAPEPYDVELPLPSDEPATAESTVQRRFFCRKSGERDEVGPVALADLQVEVDEGRLLPNDRVREVESLCWIPCRELGALRFPAVETIEPAMPGDLPDSPGAERDAEPCGEPVPETVMESAEPGSESDWEEALFAPMKEAGAEVDVPPAAVAAPAAERPVEDAPSREESTSPAETAMKSALAELAQETPTPSTQSRRTGGGGFRFQAPRLNSPLFYVLGALLIVLACFKLWPSRRGFHGEVLVDGERLPVGSLNITPDGGNPRDGFSIGVVDGEFEFGEGEQPAPGKYEVVVTIGNPLGFATARLDDSPGLAGLNGARLTTMIKVQEGTPVLIELASSDAVRLENSDISVIGTE